MDFSWMYWTTPSVLFFGVIFGFITIIGIKEPYPEDLKEKVFYLFLLALVIVYLLGY